MTRLEHSPWDPLPSHGACSLGGLQPRDPAPAPPPCGPCSPGRPWNSFLLPCHSPGASEVRWEAAPSNPSLLGQPWGPQEQLLWDSFSMGKMLRALTQSRTFGARQHPVHPSPASSAIPAAGLRSPPSPHHWAWWRRTSCEEPHCRWLWASNRHASRGCAWSQGASA